MKSKNLEDILFLFIILLFSYFVMVFIGWSFNPGKWGLIARIIFGAWFFFLVVRVIDRSDQNNESSMIRETAHIVDESITNVSTLFEEKVKKLKR